MRAQNKPTGLLAYSNNKILSGKTKLFFRFAFGGLLPLLLCSCFLPPDNSGGLILASGTETSEERGSGSARSRGLCGDDNRCEDICEDVYDEDGDSEENEGKIRACLELSYETATQFEDLLEFITDEISSSNLRNIKERVWNKFLDISVAPWVEAASDVSSSQAKIILAWIAENKQVAQSIVSAYGQYEDYDRYEGTAHLFSEIAEGERCAKACTAISSSRIVGSRSFWDLVNSAGSLNISARGIACEVYKQKCRGKSSTEMQALTACDRLYSNSGSSVVSDLQSATRDAQTARATAGAWQRALADVGALRTRVTTTVTRTRAIAATAGGEADRQGDAAIIQIGEAKAALVDSALDNAARAEAINKMHEAYNSADFAADEAEDSADASAALARELQRANTALTALNEEQGTDYKIRPNDLRAAGAIVYYAQLDADSARTSATAANDALDLANTVLGSITSVDGHTELLGHVNNITRHIRTVANSAEGVQDHTSDVIVHAGEFTDALGDILNYMTDRHRRANRLADTAEAALLRLAADAGGQLSEAGCGSPYSN